MSVGHISSNYHQHSKCRVLFVKHHYFHLSSFKKLLSSCWLIQVYTQCKTLSSWRHFRHQQNRNWNSVHHCIKTWQKMQKIIICNSALFCNVSNIFIIYPFQIILWNGQECLKNGLKSTCFESAKMLDSTLLKFKWQRSIFLFLHYSVKGIISRIITQKTTCKKIQLVPEI